MIDGRGVRAWRGGPGIRRRVACRPWRRAPPRLGPFGGPERLAATV